MNQTVCPYTDPEGELTPHQAQLAAVHFAKRKGSFLLFTSEVDFIIHCLIEHALWWTCDIVQQYTTDMLLEVDRMKLISGYKNIAALAPERGQRDFGRICEVLINFIKQMQIYINPTRCSANLKSYPMPLVRWLLTQESKGGSLELNRQLLNVTSCLPVGETLQQHAKGFNKLTPSNHAAVSCKINRVMAESVERGQLVYDDCTHDDDDDDDKMEQGEDYDADGRPKVYLDKLRYSQYRKAVQEIEKNWTDYKPLGDRRNDWSATEKNASFSKGIRQMLKDNIDIRDQFALKLLYQHSVEPTQSPLHPKYKYRKRVFGAYQSMMDRKPGKKPVHDAISSVATTTTTTSEATPPLLPTGPSTTTTTTTTTRRTKAITPTSTTTTVIRTVSLDLAPQPSGSSKDNNPSHPAALEPSPSPPTPLKRPPTPTMAHDVSLNNIFPTTTTTTTIALCTASSSHASCNTPPSTSSVVPLEQYDATQPPSLRSMSTQACDGVTSTMDDEPATITTQLLPCQASTSLLNDDVAKVQSHFHQYLDLYGDMAKADGEQRKKSWKLATDKCEKMSENFARLKPIYAEAVEDREEQEQREKEEADTEKETREADVAEGIADTTIVPTSSPSSSASSHFWLNSSDIEPNGPWSSDSMSSTPDEDAHRRNWITMPITTTTTTTTNTNTSARTGNLRQTAIKKKRKRSNLVGCGNRKRRRH